MSGFEKISKMNLADLDRPNTAGEAEEVPEQETGSDQPAEEVQAEESTTAEAQAEETTEAEAQTEEATAAETQAEQPKTEEPQKMAEPVGEHYYFDAEFTEKDLITFLFSHYYRQPLVILATIFAVVWPVYVFATNAGNKLFPLICLVFFLVYMPVSTYLKGKNIVRRNPIYQKTFHYMIDEWGFHLEIEDQAVDVRWERVAKIVYLKALYLVYTGKNNAFLIPTSSLGDRREEITAFLKEHSRKR